MKICLNGPTVVDMDTNGISATLESGFGDLTFTSITAYNEYDMVRTVNDVDQTNLLLAQFVDTQKGDSFSQEVRLASPSGQRFEWLVGGYYQEGTFERGDRGQVPTFYTFTSDCSAAFPSTAIRACSIL